MSQRVFDLKGLDCPNCSAKIEKDVADLSGVVSSSVNLVSQTLSVSVSKEYSGSLEEDVKAVVHKHEPDVLVTERKAEGETEAQLTKKKKKAAFDKSTLIRLAIGAAVYACGLLVFYLTEIPTYLKLIALLLSYLILGADVLWKAVKNITKGRIFDENFLMSVSTAGAFIIGEYPEAVAVMLFYQIGEFFQKLAVKRSRNSISELMDIRPDFAAVKRGGEVVTVSPEQVAVGEEIIVRPGEKIPLDGVVLSGSSSLDTRALTGEAVPSSVSVGDRVLSGCVNLSGVLSVRVTKAFSESAASKILELVENAASRKAPAENFITTFSRYYTPVVVILAVLLSIIPPLLFGGAWSEWVHRGFVFLVISCPCALVISIPLTFFGGIGAASRSGILVKGSNYLEALGNIDTVVFDKTGTLTKGVFAVTEVNPAQGFSKEELLHLAAAAESDSNHPIARSIISESSELVDSDKVKDYTEHSGLGVSAVYEGKLILAGNGAMMRKNGIDFVESGALGTKVYVACDGKFVGSLIIADEIKPDSRKAIEELKALGVRKCVMLTGDNEETAKSVSDALGLDEHHSGLLPNQKVEQLERLDREKSRRGKLCFVGDGINDAPVLAGADVGIAMGGLGSDAAIEAADVVLMTDEPSKLAQAVRLARRTKRIVAQNIVFAIGVKLIFLALGAFGIAGMWEAVFGDVGVMLLAVLNSMRMLRTPTVKK